MTASVQDATSPNGRHTRTTSVLATDRRADQLPIARRKRHPATVAAGALLVAVSAAVGGAVALHADHTTAVLTLAHPVAAGQSVSAADLSIAHVSGSGVHGIGAAFANELVGQTAQQNLPAGTLLIPQMFSPSSVPAAGQVVVAVAMKAGAFPPGLTAGRNVAVLQVGGSNTAAVTPMVLVPRARVLQIHADSTSGLTVVSLVVDQTRALSVSQASATGAVSLAMLPVSG